MSNVADREEEDQEASPYVVGVVRPTPLGYGIYQELTAGSGWEVAPFLTAENPGKEEMEDGSFVFDWKDPDGAIMVKRVWYHPIVSPLSPMRRHWRPAKQITYRIRSTADMRRVRDELFPLGAPADWQSQR